MDWLSLAARRDPDWQTIEAALPHAPAMRACIQDPVFHAEGDVMTHTRMVVEHMLADDGFAMLPPDRRAGLALAALLHDIAKPETRTEERDPDLGRVRVTHRNHSAIGAREAWTFLWRQGVPLGTRLQVFGIVLAHQKVFHVFSASDPREDLAKMSTFCALRELLLHARADTMGRIAPDRDKTLEALELAGMMAEEEGCLDGPWPFASDEARVRSCRGGGGNLFYTPQPAEGSRVVVLSGPPASGKDTYAERVLGDLPQVSMDDLRRRMKLTHEDNQGAVVQAATEAARVHLRAREPFVWNGVGLTRLSRDKIIDLCLAYDARVEVHAIDTPHAVTRRRNRDRDARVPDAAIARMLRRWEPVLPGEAHAVRWIDGETFEPALRERESPAPSP